MAVKVLSIREDIMGANKMKAQGNRRRFDDFNIFALNIMSSPGAGKTSLIMETINGLKENLRISVIEGDVASTIDADKINEQGVPVVQINFPGGCHLDANMVENALNNLPLEQTDLILIENVGNLICPAEFELGEHKKAILLSIPEGDDKPEKYPLMFTEADVVLVNKIDLLPHLRFDINAFNRAIRELNPDVTIFQISCTTGEGFEAWLLWLKDQINKRGPTVR
ncbi:MAG: hydrogenase nickel incorporation protein HypB [Desulfobacterales bacterium]